jgi:hypothetical protein
MIDMYAGESKDFTVTVTDDQGATVNPNDYTDIEFVLFYEQDYEEIKRFPLGDLTLTSTTIEFSLIEADTEGQKGGIIVLQVAFTDSDGTHKTQERFINLKYTL